ncbi:hypothetical protein [Streptomyces sp. 8N706]|uniref:hypothetical protein n=1 Tax=Streptomyces sp. 8N706 TaxID=3457416 RepID=UPI003FCF67CA
MAVTISLVFLFGVLLACLLRFKSLGYGSAFIAAGFGFFLATAGAAGPINELTTAVIQAVQDL